MKKIIKQKYKIGDKVYIQKELCRSMKYFRSDQEVIIMGSYEDQFSHDYISDPKYTVLFPETGYTTAWYPENVLHFVEHVGYSAIYAALEKRYEQEEKAQQAKEQEELIRQEKEEEFLAELNKDIDESVIKELFTCKSIDAYILKKMIESAEAEIKKRKELEVPKEAE